MAKDRELGAAPAPMQEKPRAGDPFEGMKFEDMKPYTTSEELPPDHVDYVTSKNNAGEAVERRSIKCGAPRFYLELTRVNDAGLAVYNLIGRYRNGKGVGQRNIRTIKVMPLSRMAAGTPKVIVEERVRDNEIFSLLTKKLKIPVAPKGQRP